MIIIVPGELPSLNEYINAERDNKYAAARMKQEATDTVAWLCSQHPRFDGLVRIIFHWYTKDGRKDADNVTFAQKFVLDGLVKGGVLPNDTREYVMELRHTVSVDRKNPRVEVTIEEIDNAMDYGAS